ncbi:MAG: hypothetical protein LKF87_04030 [Clostridium tyrobutyricum]|jgi:tetrahydromethanopterin S-methyltransferase subunit G|uniref:hypothetical protein n=1 Tax=Clostridium tyrobutyricum TaxID=1519 RepID=UPI00242CC2B0|nr:hypothetical protein [Clostridium tyrobutyricum]MCH4199227.1 hypothetical protein [Clostridium tyrobutyricum]MCH4236559.1 hypothetical protein [Clostridium tyrobutyricum]MCH4258125.1 hypothetical protein [Clostridium tyrobutyricum]MCI1239164.1 hypothetical protein [Clostridium tyrobutyricum]MCI1651364.1 hypothetical protein [Clostridium tyrobutyricum]
MEDDKMFELMTKMYAEMQKGFKGVNERIDGLENKVDKTNITIENDIKPKIEALFDGYKQNSDKLDRIEKQVSKHDEFIIRRIK